MQAWTFKALEPIVLFGIIFAVLLWQWISIQRTLRDDRRREQAEREADASKVEGPL